MEDEWDELIDAAESAASKLRQMAQEFGRANFTDRYGDGPVMARLAQRLQEAAVAAKALRS